MRIARRSYSSRVGFALALALVAAPVAVAEEPTPAKATQTALSPMAGAHAGLIAVVDPNRLPDETELDLSFDAELADALSTSTEGLYEEEHPDGSFRLNLQGRFRHVAVAHIDMAGRVRIDHGTPPLEAILVPEINSCAAVAGGDRASR